MVETEGLEKHSDQIITDFLNITEIPIPRGLIPRLFTNIRDKHILMLILTNYDAIDWLNDKYDKESNIMTV